MKPFTLAAALVLAPALAAAQPDFTSNKPPPAVDRSDATSHGTRPIEPETQVTFGTDSASLDAASTSQLDSVATWLADHPQQNIVVQGHTDRLGTDAHNLDLAKRRAERVRDHLMSWGISQDRIVLAVYGDRDAHAGTVDESDRRVTVFASRRSPDELAASVLSSTPAAEVVWTSRGTTLEERPSP